MCLHLKRIRKTLYSNTWQNASRQELSIYDLSRSTRSTGKREPNACLFVWFMQVSSFCAKQTIKGFSIAFRLNQTQYNKSIRCYVQSIGICRQLMYTMMRILGWKYHIFRFSSIKSSLVDPKAHLVAIQLWFAPHHTKWKWVNFKWIQLMFLKYSFIEMFKISVN